MEKLIVQNPVFKQNVIEKSAIYSPILKVSI